MTPIRPREPRRAIICGLWLACAAQGQPVSFQGLGALPGDTASQVYHLSADGSTVAGRGDLSAARWTRATGWHTVGAYSGGTTYAYGVSGDGSIVAGQDGSSAFKWTSGAGYQNLFSQVSYSGAYGVSRDGTTIVGAGTTPGGLAAAYRIVGTGPAQFLPTLSGYDAASAKNASHDGSIAVGWAYQYTAHFRAVRWDQAGAIVDLGTLSGTTEARAYDVCGDGSIAVGHSFIPNTVNHAVRWTPMGIDDLGTLEPDYYSSAYGVSADGSTVVGGSANHAFIWTPTLGMRDLQLYLTDLGASLPGWTLLESRSISADGRTLIGNGRNPLGHYEGWIATIPSTGTMPVLLATLAAPCRRRRRYPLR